MGLPLSCHSHPIITSAFPDTQQQTWLSTQREGLWQYQFNENNEPRLVHQRSEKDRQLSNVLLERISKLFLIAKKKDFELRRGAKMEHSPRYVTLFATKNEIKRLFCSSKDSFEIRSRYTFEETESDLGCQPKRALFFRFKTKYYLY